MVLLFDRLILIFIMVFVYMMIKITYLIESEGAIIYWTVKGLLICMDSQMCIKFTFASKSLKTLSYANFL
jgi:hypothetical protein